MRSAHKTGKERCLRAALFMYGLFAFCEAVADAYLGEQIFRLGGVLFDFAADVRHVDAQDLIITARAGPPQLLNNVVVGQYLSLIHISMWTGFFVQPIP